MWDGASPWQRIFDLVTDTTRYLSTAPSHNGGVLHTAVTTGGGGAPVVLGHTEHGADDVDRQWERHV